MPPKKKIKTDTPVCALVGGDGSLTYNAAVEHFGDRCDFCGKDSLEEIFTSVEQGQYDYGMVPIENSNSGCMYRVYNLLARHKLFIVAEHASKDEPCLIGPKGTKLSEVSRVYSHPAVLENCSDFLKAIESKHNATFDQVSVATTSVGCSAVVKLTEKGSVAISTRRAAQTHGLEVLHEKIANDKNLTTRYIILAKQRAELTKQVNKNDRKHSLALTVQNQPGSIFKMLSTFAFRDINVLKLDTRPASAALDMFSDGAKHWEYVHFLDFEPCVDEKANDGLMRDLEEFCVNVRDFGEYKKFQQDEDMGNFELLWR